MNKEKKQLKKHIRRSNLSILGKTNKAKETKISKLGFLGTSMHVHT